MLKISSKNEKLRRQLVRTEMTPILHQLLSRLFFRSKTSHIHRYLLDVQHRLLSTSSFTKIRNICILTGRNRSVYRSFRLSRIKLREYANAGYFTGLSKASW